MTPVGHGVSLLESTGLRAQEVTEGFLTRPAPRPGPRTRAQEVRGPGRVSITPCHTQALLVGTTVLPELGTECSNKQTAKQSPATVPCNTSLMMGKHINIQVWSAVQLITAVCSTA